MLALTRKAGQSIIIADQIEITVVEVKGDQVRLGIEAPKDISIYRKELYDEIQAENKTAASSAKRPLEKVSKIFSQVEKARDS